MPDLKQKTMTALMYSSGLRIGEVCSLRYEDVDRKNLRLHITHGKNRHDRYAILSTAALDLLTQYWFQYGTPRTDYPVCRSQSSVLKRRERLQRRKTIEF